MTFRIIYAKLDRVESMPLRGAEGIANKLREQRHTAFMSRDLATLLNVHKPCGTGQYWSVLSSTKQYLAVLSSTEKY